MFDISTLLVNGIPLAAVIFGLVEFIKSFGLKGHWLTGISMLIGVLLGLAYRVAQVGLPIDFAAWFGAIVFGLMLGLVTSGFYKFIDERLG
jgi:hypothetical protein